ncbi:MAG: NUDIX hydrolase [Rhodococcus sp.]|nr:NUDIX hydrolase [Rhodococcus sp. (in: high G+C Gram-positive bacteria)]
MHLTDYPRPSVAVDVAVLTVHDETLKVLAVPHRLGRPALPGTFLHQGENLADAATRALRDKAGVEGAAVHQLRMFDDPHRDDRGWVVSMAHGTTVPSDQIPQNAMLFACDGPEVKDLAFDHYDMTTLAVTDLRERYGRHPDPDHLLGESFTVLELRRLYEIVYDRALPKDSFRRQIIDTLDPTGALSATGSGRPAEMFRRRDGVELPRSATALLVG